MNGMKKTRNIFYELRDMRKRDALRESRIEDLIDKSKLTTNADGTTTYEVSLFLDNLGIVSLDGLPDRIALALHLQDNDIVSLKGLPKVIGGDLWLQNNKIESLEGLPEEIGYLDLRNNNIKSLEGLPKIIRAGLWLQDNNIESLEGLPKVVKGVLDLRNNPIASEITEEDVRAVCNVRGSLYL